MIRGIAIGLVASAALAGGCKCNKRRDAAPAAGSGAPVAAAPRDAGPRVRPATEPDPGFEARRDELLRRGDPEMMKAAPVHDVNAPPPEASVSDLVRSVSKDVMMVRAIKVDLAKRRLEVPATIALQTGTLEFVAVGKGGKTYESLLEVDATAVELRLALTLLGHEGRPPDAQGAPPPATADDTVGVAVRLPRGGKEVEVPLAELLVDRRTGKAPAALAWQVIGFHDADKAAALQTRQFLSLVAHERFAPLRVIGDHGNPYAGPDQGLAPAATRLPEVGAAVTLVIDAAAPAAGAPR